MVTPTLDPSRGGFTTKLHARCDAQGRPLGFVLTGGEAHDINGFAPLLRMIADKIEALLADKGYDADAVREELTKAGIEAVIPPKSNRRFPAEFDRDTYQWQHLIENFFGKLKEYRGITMRCCKTDTSHSAFIAIVATVIRLR